MNWTPITNPPPAKEHCEEYYVTIMTHVAGKRYVRTGTYDSFDDTWTFYNEDGECDIDDYGTIIAWMPMPEIPNPYQD